ncbi:MAG TPA: alpha/beta hydrolase [Chloroflexota bacterium]|nr:alpha/beta hydrolase [Chloroflexota bacterium]
MTTNTGGYEHHFIQTNGMTLHVVMAGPADGPPIILLHGFPECWFGWHKQIPALAAQGFRVIVPDQRGYNLSDKPRSVAAYHLDELAKDVVGLMDALGYQDVYLAGHDWGAVVGWWLALYFPQRLRKLAILNVPFPTVAVEAIRAGNREQMRKSWYVLAFQLPWLAERGFRQQNVGEGRNILRRTSHKNTFTEAELMVYEHAWEKPGAVTAMLNWYRANLRLFLTTPSPPPGSVQTPTLMLWGEQDRALGKELAPPSIALCADGRLVLFPDASHWLQHDEAEAVNRRLAEFFQPAG